jgi:putative DNA primase/helicase
MALWTLHTWCIDAFGVTPYIAILSPTMRTGKSRIIEVARELVRRLWPVTDPSAAALYRKIEDERPTVLIDEVDRLSRDKRLTAVLNEGFTEKGSVARVERQGEAWVTVDYSVFCPKLFAGISGKKLPLAGTTLDRCIRIEMGRKKRSETVERLFSRDVEQGAERVRAYLKQFADRYVPKLRNMRPDMPEELHDRAADAWSPLVAIADIVAEDWTERARKAAVALTAAVDEEPDEAIQVLLDLKQVWDAIEGPKAHSDELVRRRNQLPEPHYAGQLTAQEMRLFLKRFGIHPEPNPIRLNGRSRRGYRRACIL